ncbi:DUF4221 domain-containing protein [Belliella sp. R4-6]|uniref:DUF4221 domain-containing protein n=1 Tax=Belliella alkalica TaxID=1730871 RepID=A0ABS9VFW6_9BACT|nr:DUF4221 family protein [Belliella alkalica]MCH7415340.1 DUF4221 domain-containing protein [Belliella alkalica]
MRNQIKCIVLIVLLSNCEQKSKSLESESANKLLNYDAEASAQIILDEETSLVSRLNKKITLDQKEKLLIFSSLINGFKIYDIESQNIEQTIKFPVTGPNAVNGMEFGSGIHFVNKDTVILFSQDYASFYLANLQGEIYKKIKLMNDSISFGATALVSPLAYRKGSVYIQSLPKYPVGKEVEIKKQLSLKKIDLESGVVSNVAFPTPKIYLDKRYSQSFNAFDIVYNSNLDKFIVSFPLSDSLYLIDASGSYDKILAKSKLVDEYQEFNEDFKEIPISQLDSYFQWISDSYGALYYDEVNNRYIREAKSGISKEDFLERKLKPKKELMILDENFNQLGTYQHDGSGILYTFYKDRTFYFNKDLRKFNLDVGNEDTLYFDRIKY